MKDGARNTLSSSPDRGGADSDGYSMVSEAPSTHHCRRRRHGEKQLAPAHLDMLIFKSTDPNMDVTYTLWRFNVQGRLDQYQEESMMPHIYASLWGYPGRWVHSLEDGQNLTMTKLLEHMDHAFGDVCEYDTMICSFYEIRQKEENMLQIHEAVAVICCTYSDWVTDWGKNLVQDQFYHGLMPSLWDVLGFMMAELPVREQAGASFDTLYMLAKKMEVHQPSHPHRSGSGSSEAYRDKYRRYLAPMGWVAMIAEEELLPPDPEPPDSEPLEPDVTEGLSLRMAQAVNHYQREECHCFMFEATNHFARDCLH